MKRVTLAIVSTITGLVLLLSFKTHTTTTAVAAPTVAVSPSTNASTSSTSTPAPIRSTATNKNKQKAAISSPTPTATRTATVTAKTFTGTAVDTQYGPVEVQVTVKAGKVTAANAVEYPNQDPRDAQINEYAIPILNSEATAASSAHINTVSGASYTSAGYISSLQSALDKAGL
jgi:uncharacterized protein with FMN-binding domain